MGEDDEDPTTVNLPKDKATRHRQGLVATGFLYTLLYVGAFFGWGPMQLLLEDAQMFSSKCPDATEICPAQTAALINVQLIAQTTQVTSPLLGQIADHYGAPIAAYLMAASTLTGLGLLVFAAACQVDRLLYAAFIMLAFGTWTGGLLTVQTGMYFTGQVRSRVIFGLNALFDSGSITYLGLWGIGQISPKASLAKIAGGYLGLGVVLFGVGSYFWTVAVPEEEKECTSEEEEEEEEEPDESGRLSEETLKTVSCVPSGRETTLLTNKSEIEAPTAEPEVDVDGNQDSTEDHQHDADEADYVIIAERSPRQQLTSAPALMLAVFFGIHTTANQWALTTTRDFLAYLGDDELNNRYLTIFTLLMPASLLALPFVDAMIIRFGFHGGFQCINVLALAYNLIRITSDNLNVQIAGFIFFSFFRCFLFGVTFSFLPTILAPNITGKASGLLFLITGLTAFLNIPLANLAVETYNGDFFVPNLLYTILVVPCMAAAWFIGVAIRRDNRAKHKSVHPRLRQSYGGVLLEDLDHRTQLRMTRTADSSSSSPLPAGT